jgi:hypothetical protein
MACELADDDGRFSSLEQANVTSRLKSLDATGGPLRRKIRKAA